MTERTPEPPEENAPSGGLDQVFQRFFRRRPKQSRSRAAVDAILQAAEEMLARGRDLDDLSIEHLSARAGVAMGSFYEYFSGKDSLLGLLIGKVTRANFDRLAGELAATPGDSLDEVVRSFAAIVVETYLARPATTRVLIDGIGRLGLLDVVTAERDRFASAMAERAMPFLPGAERADVDATMRLAADAVMGVIGFAAARRAPIDRAAMTEDLAAIGLAVIRRRHGA